MPPLRIVIADDHAAVRRSIRALIESRPQWVVCGEASNGEEVVALVARLRPDVALLDCQMPHMSGIEAARQIREILPTVQVLVLTMHDSGPIHDEARRAGAREVVMKSDADRVLLDAIDALLTPDPAIPLAGSVVREQRHIGAFFQSDEERYRVLGPFIAEGIARGDKALHIVDPPDRDRYVQGLMQHGIDAPAAEARHQLDLLSWDETYLRDGRFDKFSMAAMLEGMLRDGKAEGYPMTRAVGYMEWALGDQPGVEQIVEYEARLNEVLAGNTDVVICAYDLKKFPGQLVIDVLRSHPAVIVSGALHENPFYTPPELMIEEVRNRS